MTILSIIAILLAIFSFLPTIGTTHWFFRVFDFIRIQIFLLQIILLTIGLFLFDSSNCLYLTAFIFLVLAIIYQAIIISPYIPFKQNKTTSPNEKDAIRILSVNVLQKMTNTTNSFS